jgi:hypothetical protein
MRGVLALGLMLFGLSAWGAGYADGAALYDALSRNDPEAVAYVMGVYDAVQIAQYHAQAADAYFCAPSGVTASELAEAVKKSLEREPTILSYPSGLLVFRALILAFPCGESEAYLAPDPRVWRSGSVPSLKTTSGR